MKRPAALLLTAITLACGADPTDPASTGPDPGFVSVSIVSTNPSVGALRMSVFGSGMLVDSLRAPGLRLFGAVVTGTERRAIVTGAIANGEVLRFWVPDRNALTSYRAVVDEAAAGGSYQQLAASGFAVTLAPVGN